MFEKLTPAGEEYLAGNYRGADFKCLKFLSVSIADHPGEKPELVKKKMDELAYRISSSVSRLDAMKSKQGKTVSEQEAAVVVVACNLFVTLSIVHPFANGNGHAGRLLLWAFLGRFGYWPKRWWTVDERPIPNAEYAHLIAEYRAGRRAGLEQQVLACIR
jgi:Fic family protein